MVVNLPIVQLKSMCENLGIVIKTTAAESLWSNGLVNNLILADMLGEVLEETQCDLELAVAYCVNTKKLPLQLSFVNCQLALSLISNNLKVIHKARESFIACENSEKIRRARKHNIRI